MAKPKRATYIHNGLQGPLPVGYVLALRESDVPDGRVVVALTIEGAHDLEQQGRLRGPMPLTG
jgi:hypothetical protein